jgi:hypothetical protein
MGQRYGLRRWAELYGETIAPAWRELIDKFTPDDVKAALGVLPKEAPDFPPTLPQFEAILAKVANAKKVDSTDYARGWWRSLIVHEAAQNLGYTTEDFEPVLVEHKQTLGIALRELLDEFDVLEKRTGQRTEGMEESCIARCAQLTECFQDLETEMSLQRAMRKIRAQRLAARNAA